MFSAHLSMKVCTQQKHGLWLAAADSIFSGHLSDGPKRFWQNLAESCKQGDVNCPSMIETLAKV
eukprot:3780722-Amphidinium_carterae.1